MSKKKKNKRANMSAEQRLIHSPSPMHLQACIEGGRVFRNKKKYTRKGKAKYSYNENE